MNAIRTKFKEVLSAVLPITIIVIILRFILVPVENIILFRFILGAIFIIIGLTIFLLGIDLSITPVGTLMGRGIAKSNKILIVIAAGFILGFAISVAEPDLHIFADQVAKVTSGTVTRPALVSVVSLGIGIIVSLGFLRIVYNVTLLKFFFLAYTVILILGIFSGKEFLAIAFDASGATTGAMTTPFLLALSLGVSSLKKNSKASENDSFGLVGIASSGAIIAVLALGLISGAGELTGELDASPDTSGSLLEPFIKNVPKVTLESIIALLPILVLFVIFQFISFKLQKRALRRMVFGFIFTFFGLVVFLTGVNAGFMNFGAIIGSSLAESGHKLIIVLVGFVLGFATVLSEPAVYVLTHQIESVTSGYVKRKLVLITLSLGVGISVALAMLRIVTPGLQLWHYLLPGYIIATILMFFTPPLFIGIAYDSGGVASGPMTATFILAFSNGAAHALEGADVVADGFGMIAMVAMAPVIALQVLGIVYRLKSKKGGREK